MVRGSSDPTGKEWVLVWGTDRAVRAVARLGARAGAASSRAAGRAGPARAWRGRGRRSWVAPSLRAQPSVRPPSASVRHCRALHAFFRGFFRARGGGPAPANGAPPLPRPRAAPPATPALIYVPYIKRVFRGPLWIFRTALHTSRVCATRARTKPRPRRRRCGLSGS